MKEYDKYRTRGAYHYEWYNSGEPAWYKMCVDKCVEFCKGPTLDVGCGDGVVANLIQSKGHGVRGFDNEPLAIELARGHGLADFFVHDIKKPLQGKFEYMVCLNVIEHLEWPERIKGIFNRNITKAAIIITDVPQKNPSPYHVKEFSPYELKQMFHTRKVVPFKIDDNFHGIEVHK